MKLNELGEFALINRIRERVSPGRGVLRGIGDDAALLQIDAGYDLLTSTDLLIEKSHFDFAWTTPEDLGYKAVAVNLSDIAAMGGEPRYLYLGLACPGSTDVSRIDAFLTGALGLCEAHGVTLVGGDTCSSPGPWVVSVAVEGVVPAGRAIRRDGARPGDIVLVSGSLGDSALALSQLSEGQTPAESLARRHHRPLARVDLGLALARSGGVSAMIDVSDGISSDLGHILAASQVAGVLDLHKLPLSEVFTEALRKNATLFELALNGGEDYELLLTAAAEEVPDLLALGNTMEIPITPVGSIRAGGPALWLRDSEGEERPCPARGYDHFSTSRSPGAQ